MFEKKVKYSRKTSENKQTTSTQLLILKLQNLFYDSTGILLSSSEVKIFIEHLFFCLFLEAKNLPVILKRILILKYNTSTKRFNFRVSSYMKNKIKFENFVEIKSFKELSSINEDVLNKKEFKLKNQIKNELLNSPLISNILSSRVENKTFNEKLNDLDL